MNEPTTIPGELVSIHARLDDAEVRHAAMANSVAHATSSLGGISARLDAGDLRMRFIETSLAENTAVTRSMGANMEAALKKLDSAADTLETIKDVQTGGRLAKKVIVWTGGLGAGLAGMWSAWQAFIKH